jgi:hypothetical protein
MNKVIADISMSLDGYVTARGVDQEHGHGIGGEAIHAWVFEERTSTTDQCPSGPGFVPVKLRGGQVAAGRP